MMHDLTHNRMPLNDDRQEKAIRFQSRQALQDLHLNQIKAAASPVRKINSTERATSGSPRTPQNRRNRSHEDEDNDGLIPVVAGNAMTPLKRVPILANFEEWMKMATDNKINATNSWNFALIDYFHDMSLLREGDGVNFQKASCTLDGCVKIYTSRVDSVATETGKLLSGLADSDGKKSGKRTGRGEEDETEDGEEGEEGEVEGEDGAKRRIKKKVSCDQPFPRQLFVLFFSQTRSSEATLAQSFSALQLKKFELEFSVDPLFKKASADFDEGGAKGLLLNHLAIDGQGRIVFDSSDEVDASNKEVSPASADDDQQPDSHSAETDVADQSKHLKIQDMENLRTRFFPQLELLDDQDVCPSLRTFDLGDLNATSKIPFLKDQGDQNTPEQEDGRDTDLYPDHGSNGDVADDSSGALEVPANLEFGEGGEAWARDAALESRDQSNGEAFLGIEDTHEDDQAIATIYEPFGGSGGQYGMDFGRSANTKDSILSYFDNSLRKNWAGPEHWKVRRIRDSEKPATVAPKRKEKELCEINFLGQLESSTADAIYTPAASMATISLPKSSHGSKSRNLLPDDKHFNSRQLLELFLKPRARFSRREDFSKQRSGPRHTTSPNQAIDEAYWARQSSDSQALPPDEAAKADYDADFFQDDPVYQKDMLEDDDDEFADAREMFSPGAEVDGKQDEGIGVGSLPEADGGMAAFGSQLVTQSNRIRPEYVQYAKVAKKVDVRRLKEEMWKGIGSPDVSDSSACICGHY